MAKIRKKVQNGKFFPVFFSQLSHRHVALAHAQEVAVAMARGIAHVEPSRPGVVERLHEHLVEVEPLDEPHGVAPVGEGGEQDVCGLATHVLRVHHAAHGVVEPAAAIARGDVYGAEAMAQGFEYVLAERAQRVHLLLAWGVVDALVGGHARPRELYQAEMGREPSGARVKLVESLYGVVDIVDVCRCSVFHVLEIVLLSCLHLS